MCIRDRWRYLMRKTTRQISTAMNVTIVIQKVHTNSESIPAPCSDRSGGSHQLPQPPRRSAAKAGAPAIRSNAIAERKTIDREKVLPSDLLTITDTSPCP